MSTTAAPNSNYSQLHTTQQALNAANPANDIRIQMNALPTLLRPDLLLNDTGLFTVYHFIKNFIG